MTENNSQSLIEKAKVVDAGLIGIEELDVLIRSLMAIVRLAQKTKLKLESTDMQSGVSNRSGL